MKKWKAPGYKNYGMIPINEYTITNTDKNGDPILDMGQAQQADNVEPEQRPKTRHTHTRFGRVRSRGWLRSQSTNGWRAEAASQQDKEAEHIEETVDPQ